MQRDKWIVVAAVVLAVLYALATEQIGEPVVGDPLGPKAVPRLLVIGLLISAGLLWLESTTQRGSNAMEHEPAEDAVGFAKHGRFGFLSALVAATLVYLLLFEWLGYALATALYLLGLMTVFNSGRWRANVLTAIGFSLGSYLGFTRLFGAQIPLGLLPF